MASEQELLGAVFVQAAEPAAAATAADVGNTGVLEDTLAPGRAAGAKDSKSTGAYLDDDDNTIVNEKGNFDTDSTDSSLPEATIPQMLSRCLQGLGRPLRVRILQSLEQRGTVEILYAVADLLSFYAATFTAIVKKGARGAAVHAPEGSEENENENAVIGAVRSCLTECKSIFDSAMERRAEQLVHFPPPYSLDLSATLSVREAARQLNAVIKVHISSLSGVTSEENGRFFIGATLGALLGPTLQSLRASGKGLVHEDLAVFTVNNISLLLQELQGAASRTPNNPTIANIASTCGYVL